ncbi:MAG: rRNA maturation RNase YbeY [Firmicutes bacterium]|nr:rRNA maturation RNase YbeY [Bacillota bacterium]
MPLHLVYDSKTVKVPRTWPKKIKALAASVLEEEKAGDAEVVLSLVDDTEIRELNRQYRGIDKATDVLSFSQRESTPDEPDFEDPGGSEVLGDIVISWETAQRQAEDLGHPVEREAAFLMVHGLLHLLGYDHEKASPEREMKRRQTEIMDRWK